MYGLGADLIPLARLERDRMPSEGDESAGLSRLSSVRPLCHTDQAPPRPASRLKGVCYEKLRALTGATPVRGTHGKGPLVPLEKGGSEKESDGAFGSG